MHILSFIYSSSMVFYCKFLFLIIIIATVSFYPSPANSISFNFSYFSTNGPQMINFEGDSSTNGRIIQLTANSADKARNGSVGRATYSEPIQLYNAAAGTVSDFVSQFSFSINTLNGEHHGDGLTFFLASSGSKLPPGSHGGTLGLIGEDASAVNQSIVAVEFDTFKNPWDPSSDHVGIDINSVTSVLAKDLSVTNSSKANVWVYYNSIAHNLTVYITFDEDPIYSNDFFLIYIADLYKILPENVTVGFSAATGTSFELHQILSWAFHTTPRGLEQGKVNSTTDAGKPNSPKQSNNITEGITTGGRDSKMTEGKASTKSVLIGVVVGIAVLGCALGFSLFIWLKKKKKSRNLEDVTIIPSTDDEFEKETGPKRFTYSELAHATSNFDEGGKLGEGGFGGVYKGFLSDTSLDIAVKRISSESKQGKKEYQSEVKIISQLRHRNLVQLIGWCHQKNELLLVYEFLPNRSLDKHLFQGESVLTWEVRYKIALGLASALVYLHEAWEKCVVHRDIKSSNIMLDSNFNAKLGDFGLARLVDHQAGSQTTVLAGTMGYLAPECVTTGKSSKESDVYSFGIVALELACGRKPIDASKGVLLEWVWKLYGCGMVLEAADERLYKNFDEQQMERLMVLGLCCAHPDHKSRPSIRQAISILNFESPLPVLPSKLPTLEYNGPPVHICRLDSQTDGSQGACSSCSNTNLSRSTMSSSGSDPKSLLYSG